VDGEQPDDGVPWPTVPRAARTISEAATLVRRHLLATPSESLADADTPAELTSNEREEVARWDADLNFLVREARDQRSGIRSVRLPESVSASTFMRAHADPQGLAAELARPMPRRPSPAARRGTSFHNWVERRFGQATLIDLDDLPGAVDSDRTDASMAELQAAFERSPYAVRQPVATEFPFGIVIDGRVVRGRIDAVFAVDRNDPTMTDVEFDVVDWKTGRGRGIDPLQLAIYRLAWARHVGVAESQVGAAFLLVETGEVLRPDSLPTLG